MARAWAATIGPERAEPVRYRDPAARSRIVGSDLVPPRDGTILVAAPDGYGRLLGGVRHFVVAADVQAKTHRLS